MVLSTSTLAEAVSRNPVEYSFQFKMLMSRKAQAAAEPLLTAFKQLFPKVEINITAELSKYADSKIDRSYIEGEPFVDYAMLQTVHDFPRWKAEGKLLEYKPPNFEDVNAAIKDEDGAYVPVGYSKSGFKNRG